MVRSRSVLMLAFSLVAMTTGVVTAQKSPLAQSVKGYECRTIQYTQVCLGQYVRFNQVSNGASIASMVASLTDSHIQVNGEAGGASIRPYSSLRNVRLYALNRNERLERGSELMSPNGCYRLVLQDDGNLVSYAPNGRVLWASNTDRRAVQYAIMQDDGNFVIYNGSRVVYASNTERRGGHRLILQDDSNVVIYTSTGRVLWATNTVRLCK
ncbi:D-mannose binding lectin [Leptolyngbyaceae cyanobacterium JSC-12]|nr:D-mannose binding lectin [Leptolyngbyaceae cyanobacterium JSC-12]